MKILSLFALVGMLPLVACSAQQGPANRPATVPRPAEFLDETHEQAEGVRSYKLYLPTSYSEANPVPLLVMLHGCTQNPDDFARGTRMNQLAEEHGFLVAYPEQPAAGHPQACWNWYAPAHRVRGGGEPAEIAGITRQIMERYSIDPQRVYVAGVSAGGAMAVIMAATYPDLFAAAGAHSAIAYGVAQNVADALTAMQGGAEEGRVTPEPVIRAMGEHARVVPLIIFHGSRDEVVHPANADQLARQWLQVSQQVGGSALSMETVEHAAPASGDYTFRISRAATPQGTVLLESWVVDQLGHAWAGGAPEGSYTDPHGPDASREIVRFLLQHRR